jgi:hypothetical protein
MARQTGCIDKRARGGLVREHPVEGDVLGHSGTFRETQLEREAALQQPLIGSNLLQPAEKPLECDLFTQARNALSLASARAKACLQSVAQPLGGTWSFRSRSCFAAHALCPTTLRW